MTRGNEAGFTLVEVLVATFIMALIAAMGTGLVSSVMDARDRVEALSDDTQELDLARAVIKRDLSQFVDRRPRDAFGTIARSSFEAGERFNEGRLMAFITSGREMIGPRAAASRLEYVEYVYEDGQLIRRGWTHADRSPETRPVDRVLLDDLKQLDVQFLVARGWVDAVTTGGVANTELPLAVAIEIEHGRLGPMDLKFLVNGGP